jgi:hypothetical protein
MLWVVGCGAPAPQTFHEEHPAAESRHEEKRERKEDRREERREARRENEAPGEFRESERKEHGSRDRERSPESSESPVPTGARNSGPLAAGGYDLQRDEELGGHTLRKHVGRNDEELRERLEQEPRISAASTWTNTDLAEQTVAAALRDQATRIAQWQARGERRANLALHYNAGREIGRSQERGASQAVPCTAAVIVLKANGDGFYVLTTYPEAAR